MCVLAATNALYRAIFSTLRARKIMDLTRNKNPNVTVQQFSTHQNRIRGRRLGTDIQDPREGFGLLRVETYRYEKNKDLVGNKASF